ncbi:MAG: hypothetical protein ABIP28_02070 [Mucilaginibacter sp.]
MKSNKKPATSKLVAKFDNELMQILMEDVRFFKANNPYYSNKQKAAQRNLSAA